MATVLNTSLSAVSTYTSGPLTVSSYRELFFSCNASGSAWNGSTTATISRLDADSALYPIASLYLQDGVQSLDIGPGTVNNVSIGDRVQIDFNVFGGTTCTTTVCVIGK